MIFRIYLNFSRRSYMVKIYFWMIWPNIFWDFSTIFCRQKGNIFVFIYITSNKKKGRGAIISYFFLIFNDIGKLKEFLNWRNNKGYKDFTIAWNFSSFSWLAEWGSGFDRHLLYYTKCRAICFSIINHFWEVWQLKTVWFQQNIWYTMVYWL